MRKYLVSWKDASGAYHNGVFEAKGLTNLREVAGTATAGCQITDISIVD